MYILNPTVEQVLSWYGCNKRIGEFLVNECKLPLIHRSKSNKFYFAKTEQLNNALERVPLWMKFFDGL